VRDEIEQTSREYERLRTALAAVSAEHLPRRTVHNDCKLDNLLFDATTGEARCVIDLDTVMEGTVVCDFGELVRTGTCAASEDERDLAAMRFEPELFDALARGYLAGAGALLSEAEIRALPLAGPCLTLENAIRFLTDHLEGDVYFRIHREDHNLDRCRAQLRRIQLQTEHREAAHASIERAAEQ
jgi:Ser/Thr protein kinase RdoA (MazF antagonist)